MPLYRTGLAQPEGIFSRNKTETMAVAYELVTESLGWGKWNLEDTAKWLDMVQCAYRKEITCLDNNSADIKDKIIWTGIFQYCLVRVLMTIVAVATQTVGLYCEESLSPAFSHIWVCRGTLSSRVCLKLTSF